MFLRNFSHYISPQFFYYSIRQTVRQECSFSFLGNFYALPDGQRAELIDGQMYMMAPPNARHQDIIFSLSRKIADYIDANKGSCKIYLAPYAVFLNADDKNYVEPDISVICDKESRGHGAILHRVFSATYGQPSPLVF